MEGFRKASHMFQDNTTDFPYYTLLMYFSDACSQLTLTTHAQLHVDILTICTVTCQVTIGSVLRYVCSTGFTIYGM